MAYSNHNTKKRHFTYTSIWVRSNSSATKRKKKLQEITDLLGRHKSTISRELKRGTVIQRRSDLSEYKAYFLETGQARYEANRSHCGAKYKLVQASDFIRFAVEKIQKEHWSPDAVCGFAKANQLFGVVVCTKTLYNYIDLGALPVKNIDLPLKVTRNTKKKRNNVNKKILNWIWYFIFCCIYYCNLG
ncbi:helix-turn-helix protein [Tepidibacillus fermentans]|uniref:Helix-turn-helix protein n=1 Tax=Tepidibacillus fermentans TaxID=1281767 RepID=A0A4R3K726_9BACI|nr:helix-turn-helix domain-containing protein [Tepidibacillus fermentans]TCS78627.1 helix-turn-helix protein [Tepidibacillus fermentans]